MRARPVQGVWPAVYHAVNVAWAVIFMTLALGHYRTARRDAHEQDFTQPSRLNRPAGSPLGPRTLARGLRGFVPGVMLQLWRVALVLPGFGHAGAL